MWQPFPFWDYDMQIFVLEIIERWFIHENGKQREMKKKHVTSWTDKEDMFGELMKFIEIHHLSLDEDLVFATRTLAISEGMAESDKLFRTATLFNRFSKFAAESNSKKMYQQATAIRTTWLEIFSIESKLRGSVFE